MRAAGRETAAGALALLVGALMITACGGSGAAAGTSARAAATGGGYRVQVRASFPRRQRLAEHSLLVITVRNIGGRPLPNVAVTLTNPEDGTAAQALGALIAKPKPGRPLLATRSRPVWIIDRAPGPCVYSCDDGGPGGATTAYANTWALGRLRPRHSARFAWHVTAIRAGRYRIRYAVAPALNGRDSAAGGLQVSVSSSPPKVHVAPDGTVHYG